MAGIEDEGQDMRRGFVHCKGWRESEGVWLDRFGSAHRCVDNPAVEGARRMRTVVRVGAPVHSAASHSRAIGDTGGVRFAGDPNTLFTIPSLYGINTTIRRLGSGR